MDINKLLRGAICMVAVMFASVAQANTVQWTLGNAAFDDGGTLSGTFSIDSGTGNLLSYNLTSTAGSALGGFNYNASNSSLFGSNLFSPNSFLITNSSPWAQPYLNLSFQNTLTIGGTDALITLGPTSGSWECNNCSPSRNLISGYAITAAVPEPETYGMVLAGLGLISFMVRRKKSYYA